MAAEKKGLSNTTKIVIGILIIGLLGLGYYLMFGKKKSTTPSGPITQQQAIEMSKTIADLYETESASKIAEADQMAANLLSQGWVYIGYGQVNPKV